MTVPLIIYKYFCAKKKQTESAITNALSAGIASFVYGHFQPLSTQRKIVLVIKTVVAKITPPISEWYAVPNAIVK